MTPTRRRPPAQAEPAPPPRLMVPAEQLTAEIDDRLTRGQDLLDRAAAISDETSLDACSGDYTTWSEYNEALLRRSFDSAEPAKEYASSFSVAVGRSTALSLRSRYLAEDISTKVRRLRSVQSRLGLFVLHPNATAPSIQPPPDPSVMGDDVFIVHGHDGETKVTVARFLEKLLNREPVILHEQPDRGRTIIEKFEDHAAQAACAIVLLTGDDIGGVKGGSSQPRGRQNVVLELGFFLGKLGRERVLILHESEVELPSDLSGVLYIALDAAGAWRNAVAREMQAVGLAVELKALII
jgi:predicted nucleotide-binding protein